MGWEILLETYTSRGHPMREYNIYFSELEWAELMKNLTAINARIREIELQRKQNTNRKIHMSMEQWKFTTEGEGHQNVSIGITESVMLEKLPPSR